MTNYYAIGGERCWLSPSVGGANVGELTDLTGARNNAYFQEGTDYATDPSPDTGSAGQVLAFDGVNDWAEITSYWIARNGTFSFSCWFYTTSSDPQAFWGCIQQSTSQGLYGLALNLDATESASPDNMWFYARHPTNNNLRGGVNEPMGFNGAGCWQHIAVVCNKSVAKYDIYLNGNLFSTTKLSSATGTTDVAWDKNWGLGVFRGLTGGPNSYYFNGYLDDIRTFNAEISQSNINELYQMRTPACNPCILGASNIWNIASSEPSCYIAGQARGVNNNGQKIITNSEPLGESRSVTIVSGLSDIYSPLSNGTFNKGEQVIVRATSDLAGVSNNKLLGGASNSSNGLSINELDTIQEKFYKTAIREGKWNQYSGVFETLNVAYTGAWDNTTNSDQAANLRANDTDNAANPTAAVPGELIYKTSAPDPVQDEYKPKTNF